MKYLIPLKRHDGRCCCPIIVAYLIVLNSNMVLVISLLVLINKYLNPHLIYKLLRYTPIPGDPSSPFVEIEISKKEKRKKVLPQQGTKARSKEMKALLYKTR